MKEAKNSLFKWGKKICHCGHPLHEHRYTNTQHRGREIRPCMVDDCPCNCFNQTLELSFKEDFRETV